MNDGKNTLFSIKKGFFSLLLAKNPPQKINFSKTKYIRVNAISKSFMKLPMLISLITIALGIILGIILYFKHRSLLRRHSTTELVTISLFSATKFVTVAIPGTIIWRMAEILGPFSMFITGIFYDILKPMLTIAVVGLIPKPGTATLSILIFWLMDGIMFGSLFKPITILWYISIIVATEIILYILGITSGKMETRKIHEVNFYAEDKVILYLTARKIQMSGFPY